MNGTILAVWLLCISQSNIAITLCGRIIFIYSVRKSESLLIVVVKEQSGGMLWFPS